LKFSQFASDLDKATQNQLARGQRLRELLKQAQGSPLSVAEQVALVYAGLNGYTDEIPVNLVKTFSTSLISYLETSKPEYSKAIADSSKLDDASETVLKAAIESVKETVMA
jgi:F-type H+-transporting ATPase subunit alpha